MDTFEHEEGVPVDAEAVPAFLALPCLEVVARQFDFFARQEGLELLGEEREVERLDVFVVIVAVGGVGCLVAVDEVIVEGDGDGFESAGHELHGEAL